MILATFSSCCCCSCSCYSSCSKDSPWMGKHRGCCCCCSWPLKKLLLCPQRHGPAGWGCTMALKVVLLLLLLLLLVVVMVVLLVLVLFFSVVGGAGGGGDGGGGGVGVGVGVGVVFQCWWCWRWCWCLPLAQPGSADNEYEICQNSKEYLVEFFFFMYVLWYK